MKKIFSLLSLSLLILFSSNLMASSSKKRSVSEFIRFNDKQGKQREFVLRYFGDASHEFGVNIAVKIEEGGTATVKLEDQCATYFYGHTFSGTGDVDLMCDDALYRFRADEVRPGYYIREGRALSYIEL